MDEIIRKTIYNNCGIQDGATLVGYIEEILNRNEKAIEYIEQLTNDEESIELMDINSLVQEELLKNSKELIKSEFDEERRY